METFKFNYECSRPWGSFHIIDECDRQRFLSTYFPQHQDKMSGNEVLKFLKVLPNQRLSWQYHKNRGEEWYVVQGPVKAYTSWTDDISNETLLQTGDSISLLSLQRHMLEGLSNEGIVAEIWVHNDFLNPSTEDDIVRLIDNYGRI